MKEKTDNDLIRDLFIKLKPIFSTDVYIYDWKYVIAGEDSNQKIPGSYLCILHDKYVDALKVLYPTAKVLYVEDLVEIKLDMAHFYKEMNDKEIMYKTIIENKLNSETSIDDWKLLTETCKGIEETIFDLNHIYSILVKDDECIEIGKPLLPTITAKSIKGLLFHVNYDEKREIYDVHFKHHHTHFDLYMKYYAIPMKV